MNYRKRSCCRTGQQLAWRYGSVGLLCFLLLADLGWPRPAAAHGGVVIDSGFTDHFEWLVTIDPYPLVTGQAMLTLLVYDLATYDPVSDLHSRWQWRHRAPHVPVVSQLVSRTDTRW